MQAILAFIAKQLLHGSRCYMPTLRPGHDVCRSVGGMRASIYNAMPEEGVNKLIAFMKVLHLLRIQSSQCCASRQHGSTVICMYVHPLAALYLRMLMTGPQQPDWLDTAICGQRSAQTMSSISLSVSVLQDFATSNQ